jgi:hypothetical protein
MKESMQFLSFWAWLLSCNVMVSTSPFPWKWHNFILLYGWIILHCTYIHFLNPFTSCWAPRLVLQLGYWEQCCYKCGGVDVPIVCWLRFLCINA